MGGSEWLGHMVKQWATENWTVKVMQKCRLESTAKKHVWFP